MFNFFKRKSKEKKKNPQVESIFCIPGIWKDRKELLHSIVEKNDGEYLFAGVILMNTKTNDSFELILSEEHNPILKESFRGLGIVNQVSEEFISKIENHSSVVYLKCKTGSLEGAKKLAFAGNAILKAGGIGILIETTGKAFEKQQWNELIENFEISSLYSMYVLDSISDKKGNVYSCGMHNIGLKDTFIQNISFQKAVETIRIFGYYQLIDKPNISVGQTFSTDINSPVYKIVEENSQPNKGNEYYENPFGMWRLSKM